MTWMKYAGMIDISEGAASSEYMYCLRGCVDKSPGKMMLVVGASEHIIQRVKTRDSLNNLVHLD